MKIAVYAIALNEEAFVERCVRSALTANYFVLVDTGSTDRTPWIAKELGCQTHSIQVRPWRFDVARNTALALVPPDVDVCVSLDVDEVLQEGWRSEVERCWTSTTTRLRYLFDWGHQITFKADKIHARHGYHWKYPCHETLTADPRTQEVFAESNRLLISHKADPSKSRSQYLDLLRVGATEFLHEARPSFYLARELYFHRRWGEAAQEFQRYLGLRDAVWKDERAMAMRYTGEALEHQGVMDEARSYLIQGTQEAPHLREPWMALANFAYRQKEWAVCLGACENALQITEKPDSWLVEPLAWGERPYDLAAIASYWMGRGREACVYGEEAYRRSPEDGRLKVNLGWYQKIGG